MSMVNDPKNSWDDDRDAFRQAQQLRKYNTKKDKILQSFALVGVICIVAWIAMMFMTQQFRMWHFFLIGIGLLLISFTIIDNFSLTPRIKKFSSRSDLRMGYGTVKCCFMTSGSYTGGIQIANDDFIAQDRVAGRFKLIVQGENGKIYKTTVTIKYEMEEPVVFYYAGDSEFCVVLGDEEAIKYLQQHNAQQ